MRVEHSMSHFLRAIGWIALCASAAHAQHMHMLDDGAPNRGVTWSQPADFVWLQSFEASATGDSILQVSLMLQAGAIPADTKIRLCVWEDPNNDLLPQDAHLVAQVSGVVPSVPVTTWVSYDFEVPARVQGAFFLGAQLETSGAWPVLALLDTDAPHIGRAWFAAATATHFDPECLGDYGPATIETLGADYRGVFLLRGLSYGVSQTHQRPLFRVPLVAETHAGSSSRLSACTTKRRG